MRVSVTARTMLTMRRREELEHRRKAHDESVQHELATLSDEELDRLEAQILAGIEACFRAEIITRYERQSPQERVRTAERNDRLLKSPPPKLRLHHGNVPWTEAKAERERMVAERRPQVLAEYLTLPPKERRAEAKKAALDYERHEAERRARLMGSARG